MIGKWARWASAGGALLLTSLLLGCEPGRGSPEGSATPRWIVEPDLSLGVTSGDPQQEFGYVSDVAATSAGEILVLDQQARVLRVFDDQGMFLRDIGRAGSGPGEFGTTAREVIVGRGDTIFVPDVTNARIHLFMPSGELIGAIPYANARGAGMEWQFVGDQLGYRRFTPARDGIVLFDRAGGEGRWLAEFEVIVPTLPADPMAILSIPNDPFAPTISWTAVGDRIVYGRTEQAQLFSLRVNETTPQLLEHVLVRQPIPAADREQIERLWEERARSRGLPANMPVPALAIPDSYPAFVSIVGGPESSVWVQRIGSPDEMEAEALGGFDFSLLGGRRWEVIDSLGHSAGEVLMPAKVRILEFRDGAFYGVERGDQGEARVVRLRVSRI